MSAFHVVVRPRPSAAPSPALAPVYGLFDLIVDGVNLTARIGEGEAVALLAQLGHAVGTLMSGLRDRIVLQLYAEDEAWELGLEADGNDALVSVYRCGSFPEVAVHERRVGLEALRAGALGAISELTADPLPRSVKTALFDARRTLERANHVASKPLARVATDITSKPGLALQWFANGALRKSRTRARTHQDGHLERADLHSLLVRGPVAVSARGRTAALGDLHLFLLAEQLLLLSEEVLGAWQHARPLFRRIAFGDVRLGVRRGPGDGLIAFSVTAPRIRAERSSVTFPELDPGSFVGAATSFAHTLAQDIVEYDPAQRHNLRLGSLRRSTEQLAERLSDLTEDDSRENPQPDSYRAYAKRPRSSAAQGIWSDGGKMRFLPRWVATVPNVDLRATFLCGDHLIFGAEREIASVHRRTGDVVWRQPAQRATSVITPVGLVRIHPDGRTSMHDLETGEARFAAQLEPRNGTPPSGAVVHAPGLPKLLVLAEGERRITALDLVSGEVRWRHTARRPIAPRMRRAGKLIVLADGDASLLGLDVTTGEVVWRVRHRPPFSVELALDHDSAFAITGSRGASSGLAHVDPWSGALRWATELPDRHTPGLAPLVTSEAVVVPVRDARGSGAHGFCRNTGELLWSQPPGLCSPTTAWLAVDDAVVANSAAGSLVCLDAKTGIPRYSHVFSRHVVADQPRRLEPVLRSGALFVPQHEVHVVRPRDGELLGTVPTDLIPDLLRVDEHCDVYVVEESGHVAAFGAAPKLTLVR